MSDLKGSPLQLPGRRLLLVRHATPHVDAGVPAGRWHLSVRGRQEAQSLAMDVRLQLPRIWSSPESKAQETATFLAALSGAEVAVHDGLREVGFRQGLLPEAEFRRRVASYLDGGADPDFEPYDVARQRILLCLAEIAGLEGGGGDIALVSHGRILTVLVSALLGRRLGGRLWSRIGMPDYAWFDLEHGVALAGFAAVP